MRFNEKSDVQKHFSKKHHATFLHETGTENLAPHDRTDLPRPEERRTDTPAVIAEEDLIPLA